jgi:hypothetical protein
MKSRDSQRNLNKVLNMMLRLIKCFSWVLLLGLSVQCASGFSLIGPPSAFEVTALGYDPLPADTNPTGPQLYGRVFRRSTPVLYYSFDESFENIFGAKGEQAVRDAFAILNSLTNLSSYSSELTEFPYSSSHINPQAEALSLTDVKSFVLHLIVRELGLDEPERFTWALTDRWHAAVPQPCPIGEEYIVTQFNYDPLHPDNGQGSVSSYVNGTLYNYYIKEFCEQNSSDPLYPVLAVAYPIPADPNNPSFTSVAAYVDYSMTPGHNTGLIMGSGKFYTGLTRDDVAGLRYLMSTNSIYSEGVGGRSELIGTNLSNPVLLTNSYDLGALATLAPLYDDITLSSIFVGLQSSTLSTYWTNVVTATVGGYYTNAPAGYVGAPPIWVSTTSYTTNRVLRYKHSFGNVYTFTNSPDGWHLTPLAVLPQANGHTFAQIATFVYTNPASPPPIAPVIGSYYAYGSIYSRVFVTNAVTGQFFIMPSDWCDVAIVDSYATNLTAYTVPLYSSGQAYLYATNALGSVQAGVTGGYMEKDLVVYGTNIWFDAYPIVCGAVSSNAVPVARRRGIDRITFVEHNFDVSRGGNAVTNEFSLEMINSNSEWQLQRFRRTVTVPDFLFSAETIIPGPAQASPAITSHEYGINFDVGNNQITTPVHITLNVVESLYDTGYDEGSDNPEGFPMAQYGRTIWASFDGTTNSPVIYPNTVSISNLLNELVITIAATDQISGNSLGTTNTFYGVVNKPFQVQLSASGGSAPYSWNLSPMSDPLPQGLSLSSGVFSGTPSRVGTSTISLNMTDSTGRTVSRSYAFIIKPN